MGCTQIKIYPHTSIEPQYGAFYLKKEVSDHTLSLVSWLEKVLSDKSTFYGNVTHTNQNIPFNL